MEDVLEVYQRPHDPDHPLVCVDESSKQLIKETRTPIGMKPGQPRRYDYEYERNGTANLFMMFAPLEGWRRVKVTDRHTAVDYAHLFVVHFFREVGGAPVITKEILSERTHRYQSWVEAFARNHRIPIAWAEKGIRKEDFVLRWQRRMGRNNGYGVYFIFKSMEVGSTFRIAVPKYPTRDPNYRIIAKTRSRF